MKHEKWAGTDYFLIVNEEEHNQLMEKLAREALIPNNIMYNTKFPLMIGYTDTGDIYSVDEREFEGFIEVYSMWKHKKVMEEVSESGK